MKKRKHIILTSYSGGGKSLISELIQKKDTSVSPCKTATTRSPRPGHESEYFFMTEEEFLKKKAEGFFIETNMYLASTSFKGFLYGTPKDFVEERRYQSTMIFNVDPNGAHALKKYFGDECITVFIDVEDVQVLKDRILARRTNETDAEIQERLLAVDTQSRERFAFDYNIVNRQGMDHAEEVADQILAWSA